MSFDVLSQVDWLAVVVAAVAWFVLGAAWYIAPPIAKLWQRAGGIEVPEDAGPNISIFVLTLLAYFVAATVTAMLGVATGTSSVVEGAVLGVVVGIGYALTSAAISAIYDRKPEPFNWFWVNGVFNVLGLTVVGAIIGAFAR
jgi:MFS family permease